MSTEVAQSTVQPNATLLAIQNTPSEAMSTIAPEQLLSVQHGNGEVYTATAKEVGRVCTAMMGKPETEIEEAVTEHNAMMDIINASKQQGDTDTDVAPSAKSEITPNKQNKDKISAVSSAKRAVSENSTASQKDVHAIHQLGQIDTQLDETKEDYRNKARRVTFEKLAADRQRAIEAATIQHDIRQIYSEKTGPEATQELKATAPAIAKSEVKDKPATLVPRQTGIPVETVPTASVTPIKPKPQRTEAPPIAFHAIEEPTETASIAVGNDESNQSAKQDSEIYIPSLVEAEPDALPAPFNSIEEQDNLDLEFTEQLNFTWTENGLAYLPQVELEPVDDIEDYIAPLETPYDTVERSEAIEMVDVQLNAESHQELHMAIHEFVESLRYEVEPESIEADETPILELANLDAEFAAVPQTLNVQEKLEAVLIQLFENLEVEPTPETIRAFIGVLKSNNIEEILAVQPEEVDVEYLSKRLGTSEFLQQVKHALTTIQKVAAKAYSIGASVVRLYKLDVAPQNI